jgi:hypothetical protein
LRSAEPGRVGKGAFRSPMPPESDSGGLPASGARRTGISPSASFSGRGGPSNRFLGRSPGTAEPTERLTAYDSSFRKGKKGSLAAPIGPLGRRPRVKPPRGRPARPSGGAVGRDFGAERVSVPFSFSRALAAPRRSAEPPVPRRKKRPRSAASRGESGKRSQPRSVLRSPAGKPSAEDMMARNGRFVKKKKQKKDPLWAMRGSSLSLPRIGPRVPFARRRLPRPTEHHHDKTERPLCQEEENVRPSGHVQPIGEHAAVGSLKISPLGI